MAKKKVIYTLTIISMCYNDGRDIHSYTYSKKADAQKAMREQFKADKDEFAKDERVAILERDCYKLYRRGHYHEDHIHADITKTILDEYAYE